MKKSLIVFVSVIALGLATGCGSKSKTLECSKSQSQSGIELKQVVKANFKGNEVEKVIIDMDAVLPEQYQAYKSTYLKTFESSFASYKNLKGVDLKVSETKDGVNIKMTAELSKMDDEAKNKLDVVDTKASYDKSIKDFESQGYTCKK